MKRKSKIILISTAMVYLVACAKLDLTPVDSITQDKFWSTPDEAAAAAVGLNDNLQTVALWTSVWGDLRADIFSSTRGNLVQELTNVMKNNLTSGSAFGNWTRLYITIGTANWMLRNLPRVSALSEAQRNQYEGEALFARAFCYYYAVRLWGNVPLITDPYTSANDDFFQPRSNKADVYAQIEKDTEAAIAKLPISMGSISNTKGRPTKWAALSLKTDYSLWMAKVESQPGYAQKSLDAANELISSSGLSLVSTANYASLFAIKNTTESIYEIQFNNSINELQDNGAGGSNSPAALTSYEPFGSFNRLLVHEKLIASLEPGDARADAVILDNNSAFPKYIKYRGAPTGVQQRTYYDANIIIYRLADIILLKAEALNELGRTSEAIIELNKIRSRAALPPSTAATKGEVKEAILKERYIELSAEGKRWFDLVRNGAVTKELPWITDSANMLWPINIDLLNANPNLVQNEFYQ